MTTERDQWPDVSRIFAAAASLTGDARATYLAEACGNDPALRAAVDSMLAGHDQAASFGNEAAFPLAEPFERLAPGSRIGTFRIDALLGAGGMGEVYRAHDTRLGRSVAIKVLPDSFAHDADRRARFEQEARALAALNHPNVGAIYGVEESEDVAALVLELVEGPTLAERLRAGAMPIDEVASTAKQIAEALEAAHDRGIVHRDLKPANIKITPDGVVKVLDFGLAKLVDAAAPPVTADGATGAPTATRLGLVVGTAGYMSPEQARGQTVDKRTDIWAFGGVVFEMCTGQPPFAGTTVTDTLAAVIEREPDWTLLTARTPLYLIRLIRRCLTKDPKQRLRDIGEARIALANAPEDEPLPISASRAWRAAAIALAVIVIAGSIAVAAYLRGTPRIAAAASPVRFFVSPPEGAPFTLHPARTFFALSPDGSQLAFIAGTGRSQVWLRAVANLAANPVPGTDGATSVFWSPDGRSLAFFADNKLKRVDLPDGAAVPICNVPGAFVAHGTWGRSGVILFSNGPGQAIYRVPAAGGTPSQLVTPDRANSEVRVHWPSFLPDGRRFLYTARRADGEGQLKIGDLAGGTRILIPGASNAQWVDPNVVVFVREGVLMGQRVDLDAVRPIDEPFSLAEQVEYLFTTSRAAFSTSYTGTIAYHAHRDLAQLVWADQRGNQIGTVGAPADYESQSVRLSADSKMLLTARRQSGLGTFDVWRRDLIRGTEERLTSDRGVEVTPVLADGERTLVYAADRAGFVPTVFRKDLLTGAEEQLLPNGLQRLVMDVIPGQHTIVYVERSPEDKFDIFRLPLAAGASPEPVAPSQLDKFDARVSPDGRAIAFAAIESQRLGVYVAPLPVTSAPLLIGSGGYSPPRWGGDGRLYYVGEGNRVTAVPVRTRPSLLVGTPQQLFELKSSAMLFDVARDGRFLLLVPKVRAADGPIAVATSAITADRP